MRYNKPKAQRLMQASCTSRCMHKEKPDRRERLHKEVASPYGFVVSQYDLDCREINTFGGLQNETAVH